MHFREFELCDVEVSFLRQGMSGDIGFELMGPADKGVEVYNAILQAGERRGIKRLGMLTKLVNHVEACYPTSIIDYTPAAFDLDDEDHQGLASFMGEGGTHMNPAAWPLLGSVESWDEMEFSPCRVGLGENSHLRS